MNDAEKREKVIRGLERFIDDFKPFCGNRDDWQRVYDALALLKEQEARVLTLEELRNVGQVWENSAPPYLWLDKNRSIYNTISFWCAWRDIYEMIHGRHDKYTDENYGSEWRCWTARPTEQQMRDTKWEDKDAE